MKIDHIHFYVEDAIATRNWFTSTMGFRSLNHTRNHHTHTEVVTNGAVYFVLSSCLRDSSPVSEFLKHHPPGVVDVAFCVQDIEPVINRAIAHGAEILQPIQQQQYGQGTVKSAQIKAWETLRHTIVQRSGLTPLLPFGEAEIAASSSDSGVCFTDIDHVVLNVAIGDLEKAVAWYEEVFGFQPQQMFAIQTDRSGLCSRVMEYPHSQVKLPINEPTSENSQIQEFLNLNRGAGIQHIALHTENIVEAIAHLRQSGLTFLQVPASYYRQLRQRSNGVLSESQLRQIEAQQLLVDWQTETPEAVLLQTFTQPVFEQPTFFFELIERQTYRVNDRLLQAQGFGEGNFRALFEAIEREQLKRGTLKC